MGEPPNDCAEVTQTPTAPPVTDTPIASPTTNAPVDTPVTPPVDTPVTPPTDENETDTLEEAMPNPSSKSDDDDGLGGGAIAGIVIGSVAGFAIFALIASKAMGGTNKNDGIEVADGPIHDNNVA